MRLKREFIRLYHPVLGISHPLLVGEQGIALSDLSYVCRHFVPLRVEIGGQSRNKKGYEFYAHKNILLLRKERLKLSSFLLNNDYLQQRVLFPCLVNGFKLI